MYTRNTGGEPEHIVRSINCCHSLCIPYEPAVPVMTLHFMVQHPTTNTQALSVAPISISKLQNSHTVSLLIFSHRHGVIFLCHYNTAVSVGIRLHRMSALLLPVFIDNLYGRQQTAPCFVHLDSCLSLISIYTRIPRTFHHVHGSQEPLFLTQVHCHDHCGGFLWKRLTDTHSQSEQ